MKRRWSTLVLCILSFGAGATAMWAQQQAQSTRREPQFENDHVRVFEVRLEPGERGAFHVHDQPYFWTVVEPGRGLQRFADGTYVVRDYALGETRYLTHSEADPLVHDLENVGTTTLRFVTVALQH